LGKETAVLFPSGTMAQQIALRIWCDRKGCSTVGFHPQCHLDVHEERGYEHLHNLHARPIGHRDRVLARTDLDEVNEPLGALLAGPEDVIAEARVWRGRHGGRLSTYEPMALSAERGLDELLPRMPAFVRKAREIGVALARVDGIDVVPDPPQVAMLHIHVRGELERLRDVLFEIAKERRTLIAGYFAPTSVARVQMTEITIGSPSLDVQTDEIAELYAELVSRAA